jgi:hypothetical protein
VWPLAKERLETCDIQQACKQEENSFHWYAMLKYTHTHKKKPKCVSEDVNEL